MEERINITAKLQTACCEAYTTVVAQLQDGLNEFEISEWIREEMLRKGISDYWYDIPIFVLIGTERFLDIPKKDYTAKSPRKDIILHEGDPIYIDIHPQDPETKIWGDWNSMVVFHPRESIDDEQVAFLEEIRSIQRSGIEKLKATMTISEVASYFSSEFNKRDITLSDVRNTVGHSMHSGPKLPEKRTFLETGNNTILGEGIYAIEPGGYRTKKSGDGIVIGRFEECVYIPKEGETKILGRQTPIPVIIEKN